MEEFFWREPYRIRINTSTKKKDVVEGKIISRIPFTHIVITDILNAC